MLCILTPVSKNFTPLPIILLYTIRKDFVHCSHDCHIQTLKPYVRKCTCTATVSHHQVCVCVSVRVCVRSNDIDIYIYTLDRKIPRHENKFVDFWMWNVQNSIPKKHFGWQFHSVEFFQQNWKHLTSKEYKSFTLFCHVFYNYFVSLQKKFHLFHRPWQCHQHANSLYSHPNTHKHMHTGTRTLIHFQTRANIHHTYIQFDPKLTRTRLIWTTTP